ncbi:hypothetical protein IGI37_003483 [Enterococcus sp. AZ194]|uniref:competence type IV pilus minor pilin ComGG n=1 Tax=Enterococcus sp. AZ194 TaxID=2774629 RepID=UPI003F258E0B
MGTNIGGSGQSQNKNRGGIFLSVLLFFSLTTSLLLIVLEDEKLNTDFMIRTTNLYYAKTIKELFLTEYYGSESESAPPPKGTSDDFPKSGERLYNKGTLTYTTEDKKLIMEIKIKEAYYRFEEEARK